MDGEPLDPEGELSEMTVETGVERLTALVLLLTCLSHVTAPAAWAAVFERIANSKAPGLATAAIHLPLGLMLVAFHNIWSGPALIFTLIGWALLLKGALHLLFPTIAKVLQFPAPASRPVALPPGWDPHDALGARTCLAGVSIGPAVPNG
jgi:hypothetical protein